MAPVAPPCASKEPAKQVKQRATVSKPRIHFMCPPAICQTFYFRKQHGRIANKCFGYEVKPRFPCDSKRQKLYTPFCPPARWLEEPRVSFRRSGALVQAERECVFIRHFVGFGDNNPLPVRLSNEVLSTSAPSEQGKC